MVDGDEFRIERRRLLAALGFTVAAARASARELLSTASPTSLRAQLSLNESPFGPSPGAVEAIQHELPRLFRYTGDELDALIGEIAQRESVAREQVIIGEVLEPLGIHLSLAGGPGGEFLYSDPGYTALIDAAAAVGGKPVAVPLNASLENDLAGIAARINDRTRAVFLVNPHNPTGILADAGKLRDFALQASRRTLVIVDEAYLEYADDFQRHTLVDLARAGGNVIVFRTFDKIHGLAALGFGYCIVPRDLARVLMDKGANNPHLINRLSVAAARASLRSNEHLEQVRKWIAAEREGWFQHLHAQNLRHTPSVGNFVFFETGVPHDEFAAAMREHGVAIGRAYPPYERWARISIGLPAENALARASVTQVLRKS
jgi:histidinol-phosphate aminotransferase